MWQNYGALAEQRLRELHEDAALRRSLPRRPRRHPALRAMLGRALVRWGERLVGPVGSSVAHR